MSKFQEYFEAAKGEFPYIGPSNQADDHCAIWINPNYKLTTTEGWDGQHSLAIMKKTGKNVHSYPTRITEDKFIGLAKHYGVPKWLIDEYIKQMGYCGYHKKTPVKDL